MRRSLCLLVTLMLFAGFNAEAQFGPGRAPDAPFSLLTDSWNGRWISVPDADPTGYGVYYFRKDIDLPSVPSSYPVHVTGDNRYKLYVNGTLVSLGPARSDATHWNYETVDLSPYLKAGKNVIGAIVYHEGPQKPDSQITVSVGFLLQGEGEAKMLFTDNTWKCIQDPAYKPLRIIVPGYYVAGPGEDIDMNLMISDWDSPDADLSSWVTPRVGQAGEPKDFNGSNQGDGHNLRASTLPQMERTTQRLVSVRGDGGLKIPSSFPSSPSDITVPAGTAADILLDQSFLTNAYFHMKFSGGKDAVIRVGYAESLYLPAAASGPEVMMYSVEKGNRDEVDGKNFMGREDRILSNGKPSQQFNTLSWRTYRYVRLHVETASDPLVINDIWGTFTGYPFTLAASLDTDSKEMQDLLSIGWRTARLCAVETYMDCPYYEQLQYLGDTRIQALVTLFNAKDDRLVKNFLYQADISRNADGITKSRYPTTLPQYIQPYALCYIYALHDYMMYGKDTDFVWDLLPGAEQIMRYFAKYQQEDGRVKNLPGWNFSDWVYTPQWNYGAPLKGADGCSINMDLQLLYAMEMMADMEAEFGNTYMADKYADDANKLSDAIQASYWNPEKGLYSDRSEKDNYSQHANALAILCGMVDSDTAKSIGEKLLTDASLNPCSVYYKFYLHQALVRAGLGDGYMDWLGVWRENISMGMTTWGETSDVNGTRSDCHAWGASPNIELFRTVLGIDSDAVAFSKVKIAPNLGSIKKIGGTMPHPSGDIKVSYQVKGKSLKAEIDLPQGVSGTFRWKDKEYALHGGKNSITAK